MIVDDKNPIDIPVYAFANQPNSVITSYGIYTNAGSVASIVTLGSALQENIQKPIWVFFVNRSSADVTFTPSSGAFQINRVSTPTFVLRPNKSAFITWDGNFWFALFAEEPSTTQRFTPIAASTTVIVQSYTPLINTILVPAGTIATATVTLPSTPFDGQQVVIKTRQDITSLTVNGGTISGTATTTLLAGGSLRYVYSAVDTTWDKL